MDIDELAGTLSTVTAGPGRNGAAVQVRSTAASSSRLVTPSLP